MRPSSSTLYIELRVGDAASNVYAMGEKLELIAEKIHRAGITILLAHHFRKQGQSFHEAPELEDLSQSGVAEFGRQFILLKRKEKYQYDGQHKLWFTWGGSAGHQGAKVLVAETGTRKTGIVWKPSVLSYQEFADSESAAKDLVKGEKRRIFAEHLKKLLTNLPGLNSTEIKKSIQGRPYNKKNGSRSSKKLGSYRSKKAPGGPDSTTSTRRTHSSRMSSKIDPGRGRDPVFLLVKRLEACYRERVGTRSRV